QASAGDCLIDPAVGAAGRRTAKAAVPGAPQLDTKSDESGEEGVARSARGSAPASRSTGRSGALARDHDRPGSASGETDAHTDFRRRHEVTGEDRECVRAAH